MEAFLDLLRQHICVVEKIADKVENGESYMVDIGQYMLSLSQMITDILQMSQESNAWLQLDVGFVMQVLNDILYGVEHRDSVFLLDVLRYGLLEVFYYIETELQSGVRNE